MISRLEELNNDIDKDLITVLDITKIYDKGYFAYVKNGKLIRFEKEN